MYCMEEKMRIKKSITASRCFTLIVLIIAFAFVCYFAFFAYPLPKDVCVSVGSNASLEVINTCFMRVSAVDCFESAEDTEYFEKNKIEYLNLKERMALSKEIKEFLKNRKEDSRIGSEWLSSVEITLKLDAGEAFRATFESNTLLNKEIIGLVTELFSYSNIAEESMILSAMVSQHSGAIR